MIRKIIITEQPGGGYRPMIDGQFMDVGCGDVVHTRETATHLAGRAANDLMGFSEIYVQVAPEFVRTVTGKSAKIRPFSVGDRVFQLQGDTRLYGEVGQSEVTAGVPQVDGDGKPVLCVISDDGDVYDDPTKWTVVSDDTTP